MTQYFEVTVLFEAGMTKSGNMRYEREVYLVDAMSVTEAESRVAKFLSESGNTLTYEIRVAKQSRIVKVIS